MDIEHNQLEKQCIDCYRKHIGTAHAYFLEAQSGRHPGSFWKGIGQLVLAENHTRQAIPDICNMTEKERLIMMEDDEYYFDYEGLIIKANNIIIKVNEEQSDDLTIQQNEEMASDLNYFVYCHNQNIKPNYIGRSKRAIKIFKEYIEYNKTQQEKLKNYKGKLPNAFPNKD